MHSYLPKALCGGLFPSEPAAANRRMLSALNAGEGRQEVSPNGACGIVLGDLAKDADGRLAAVIGEPAWSVAFRDLAAEQGAGAALLSAYRNHDLELFKHLGGAFAFLLVDSPRRRLLAGVDRMGRHPLYFSGEADGMAVGSRADLPYPGTGQGTDIDPQGLYSYVYFHMVPSPGCIFNGVRKLPASHYVLWQDGRAETRCYWHPEFVETPGVAESELAREMLDIIAGAVASAAAGDDVGAFLSGGLDSSTVAGMLARSRPGDARTYSIGFEAEGYDEMSYARIAAQRFANNPHEYYVTPEDVVEAVPRIAGFYDEPFGNSSALPAFFCARMAREDGVKRLLGGDGGDEIFAGNERYQNQAVFELYFRAPTLFRRGMLEPLLNLLRFAGGPVAKARSYVEQANVPLPDRLQTYNYLHRHAPSELFEGDFLEAVDTDQPLRLWREVYQRPRDASALNRMLYLDWQFTLADNDLRKVSGMCDLAGVEVVYPLLDDALVNLSCRVPSHWKMTLRELRRFYKHAVKDFLPSQIIHKSKHGFGLPFGVWMQDYAPLRELAYDSLGKLRTRGFIRPEFIDQAIEMHRTVHAGYYGELIWILMMLELWLDTEENKPRAK